MWERTGHHALEGRPKDLGDSQRALLDIIFVLSLASLSSAPAIAEVGYAL
jgi:hypothetical protein